MPGFIVGLILGAVIGGTTGLILASIFVTAKISDSKMDEAIRIQKNK